MPRREDSNVAVLDRREELAQDTGTDTDTDTAATNGTAEAASNGAEGASGIRQRAPKRNPDEMGPNEILSINLRIPNGLRMKMASTATEQNTSVPQLVAKMLADAFEYELPKPARAPRVKKYATAEERKQAQKDAQAKQRLITKAVLKAVEDGQINLDVDALVAKIKAEEEAKAAATATEGATATS